MEVKEEPEEGKVLTKKYSQPESEEGKVLTKKYSQPESEEGKVLTKKYSQTESEEGKVLTKKYTESEEGKVLIKKYSQTCFADHLHEAITCIIWLGTGQKPPRQKAHQYWNNYTILLHLFY